LVTSPANINVVPKAKTTGDPLGAGIIAGSSVGMTETASSRFWFDGFESVN
jgi:hypothetical protein